MKKIFIMGLLLGAWSLQAVDQSNWVPLGWQNDTVGINPAQLYPPNAPDTGPHATFDRRLRGVPRERALKLMRALVDAGVRVPGGGVRACRIYQNEVGCSASQHFRDDFERWEIDFMVAFIRAYANTPLPSNLQEAYEAGVVSLLRDINRCC